ncbi:SDR family oxidoreductase [Flavobacterium algicola]|uniref:SDR family oxidoreductase n=1 Tax=Flavobacterium algicola TaxID=556529 RepID=UPI001EFDE5BD|nr:SDR family oxidoreductase [Flavobacterium algicola]MCG9793864.1 SDR family oxidoreductase [Flavobacterium algicola]
MHFKNKIVWITGASSGIGKELAYQLSRQGAILILTATNKSALEQLKVELANSKVDILPFDLLKIDAIPQLVSDAIAINGQIDFVIQSAGQSQRSMAVDTGMGVYERLMNLNYFAPVALTQAILPHFIKRDAGSMTVISSIAGLIGFPLRSSYSASKHAIKGYLETLQCEIYKTNIHVSIVYPGRINTDISKNALSGDGQRFGDTDENSDAGMEVDLCVKKIISGILKKKKVIYILKAERLLFWLWWFIPNLYYKIAHKKGVQ